MASRQGILTSRYLVPPRGRDSTRDDENRIDQSGVHMSVNSFNARRILDVDGQSYEIYDITKVDGSDNLPYSLKVLLENLLR
ncbi:hypothetical protein NPS74_22060, partial [Cutibacterium acnes subsp. acnes]|nr:hypothetical protein [Cutibacterium acnes subsp. acnes]